MSRILSVNEETIGTISIYIDHEKLMEDITELLNEKYLFEQNTSEVQDNICKDIVNLVKNNNYTDVTISQNIY